MKMNVSLGLVRKLKLLVAGESIPSSQLKGDWVEVLKKEGLLQVVSHGSKRSLRTTNTEALRSYLPSLNDALRDLEAAERLLSNDEEVQRSEQVALTGNSKVLKERTCPGFLVNCYEPILARLNGEPFEIAPADGSFVFVADWQRFEVPASVLIIGIENMENFRFIRLHGGLFERQLHEGEKQILFVSRYPQSADLRRWLMQVPNRYVHFGDFDLAGIRIFLSEFGAHLPGRASFLIPSDIEVRLPLGSAERYNNQYERFKSVHADDAELQKLIDLIHRYRRGYDQEGYIGH